jgi:hypothetical protein
VYNSFLGDLGQVGATISVSFWLNLCSLVAPFFVNSLGSKY